MRLTLGKDGEAKRHDRLNSNSKEGQPANDGKPDQEPEQVHDIVGHFGRYQLLIFLFKILIGVTSAFNNLGVTFYAPTHFVGYWCADTDDFSQQLAIRPPPLPDAAGWSVNSDPASATHQHQRQLAALNALGTLVASHNTTASNHSFVHQYHQPPVVDQGAAQGYSSIFGDFISNNERTNRHRHVSFNSDTPKNVRKECEYLSKSDMQNHTCSRYNYNTGIWISTIIDEWDLVCDQSWLISLTQSLYMSGFIVSYPLFGFISDRYGRWKSLMIGALIEMSCGFGCAYATSITSFMLFRFLVGLGNAGRTSSSYLVMIEWIGPRWRMQISTWGSLGWVLGYCTMPWITLYFLHFRHMQLFACLWELIFIIWLLRIPESPRWLLTHRRFEEAYNVLLMAAKFNGLILPAESKEMVPIKHQKAVDKSTNSMNKIDIEGCTPVAQNGPETPEEDKAETTQSNALRPYSMHEFDAKFERLVTTFDGKEFTKNENNLNIFDLFKWRNLRTYLMILSFVWAANSFIYYGIVLRVGDFGGNNIFISFTIAGLTEFPSMIFTIVAMKYLPRRMSNIIIFSMVGLLCGLQIPLKYYDYQWLQQTTIMIAKLFNSCAFTCILYQTMELFPTSIRQTSYSCCSLAGRVGSILAPFVKELAQKTNDSVPPVIYAVLSIATVCLISGLPETKGADLHDTLLEAEKFKGVDLKARRASKSSTN